MTEEAKTQTEATTASQATATESAATETTTASEQQQTTAAESLLSSTEQKATETKTEETKQDTKSETKAEGAPEKYDFKAPEGKEYDPDVLNSFAEAAREANLNQESAQKLLDKMAPTLAARQQAQIEAEHAKWVETAKTDKEFGGDKLNENLGIAKKALDLLDPIPSGQTTTQLRTLLKGPLGNHPEVVRLLYRAGKAISEDTFVGGKGATSKSPEAVFYPTMQKK